MGRTFKDKDRQSREHRLHRSSMRGNHRYPDEANTTYNFDGRFDKYEEKLDIENILRYLEGDVHGK
jgi:hypothetical protein